MEEEIIAPATPTPPTAPPAETPVRTLPMDEVRRLIRKVSKDHESLFRRLAK